MRLYAAEAASGGDADEHPLAPFPPQPESPQAVAAEGEGEGAHDVAVENVEDEMEYGSGESALAIMYEDVAEPDVYVGMDMDPANTPLLPLPTAVPPSPEEVRAARPPEHLPLSVSLSVGCRLDEAGLEDVRRHGVYVAVWRSGVDAWHRELGMKPLTPQAQALHPEGMEATGVHPAPPAPARPPLALPAVAHAAHPSVAQIPLVDGGAVCE